MLDLDASNFDATVKSGVVVVDFWAEWCGPCRMYAPTFKKTAAKFDGKAVFGKFDTEASFDLTRTLKVNALPTTVIFKDGKEVWKKEGLVAEAELTAEVEKALA